MTNKLLEYMLDIYQLRYSTPFRVRSEASVQGEPHRVVFEAKARDETIYSLVTESLEPDFNRFSGSFGLYDTTKPSSTFEDLSFSELEELAKKLTREHGLIKNINS